MKCRSFLVGFFVFFALFARTGTKAAEDCRRLEPKRGNWRSLRRYQPKITFCSQCQPQHRNLLIFPGTEMNPDLKKCFYTTRVEGTANLPSFGADITPETFVLIQPGEEFLDVSELVDVVAATFGNVSLLFPANSSAGEMSKRCRSLGSACHQLDSLLPVLSQLIGSQAKVNRETRKALVDSRSLKREAEVGEFPHISIHKQLDKLVTELCKRDRGRNRLFEIVRQPADSYSTKGETVEGFKFGLSLRDILPLDSKSYDKNWPPKLGGEPTVVYFHVTVLSLDSINEESMTYVADIFLAQSWRDPRLRLPESMSEEYRILDVDWLHDIWRPDCFFKNAKQVTFHEISIPNHYVWLYHDKTILYMSKLTLVLSCAMKFETYPHDVQVCSMMIESLSHTVQDLVFIWNATDPLVMNPEIELPQQDISNNYTTDCTVHYSTGNFTCVAVVFTLKRRLGYHLLHTYIPSALIVVMSWISFWIKPEAIPARVTLGVTSLLTLATQNTQSQQSLPPVSYVKAIDIWMSACSVFVFLSLMEFAIVNNYISSEAMAAYSDEDLRATVDEYRVHPALPTHRASCYGKETVVCIDRFSRYFFPFSFFVLNTIYWSVFL